MVYYALVSCLYREISRHNNVLQGLYIIFSWDRMRDRLNLENKVNQTTKDFLAVLIDAVFAIKKDKDLLFAAEVAFEIVFPNNYQMVPEFLRSSISDLPEKLN